MNLKQEILETETALAANRTAKAAADKEANRLFDEGMALQRRLDELKAALYDGFAVVLASKPEASFAEIGADLDAAEEG